MEKKINIKSKKKKKKKKPLQWEACARQLENSPHSPQLRKAHMQQGRLSAAKNQQIKIKK